MPSLRSIFSLLALGSVMVDNPMPQRVLARAIRVVALVILGSMLSGAFLIALIAVAYKQMVVHGVTEGDAMLYVLGIVFLLAVAVIITAYISSTSLLDEVKSTIKKPIPLTTHLTNQAGGILEAFIIGFLDRHNNKPKE